MDTRAAVGSSEESAPLAEDAFAVSDTLLEIPGRINVVVTAALDHLILDLDAH